MNTSTHFEDNKDASDHCMDTYTDTFTRTKFKMVVAGIKERTRDRTELLYHSALLTILTHHSLSIIQMYQERLP